MPPVKIRKVKGGYSVRTPGGVKAKKTTLSKAKKQRNLIQATEHGWRPTGAPARKRKKATAKKKRSKA